MSFLGEIVTCDSGMGICQVISPLPGFEFGEEGLKVRVCVCGVRGFAEILVGRTQLRGGGLNLPSFWGLL